jgi:hypothetical protein
MNNASLTENDCCQIIVYDKLETIELFGKEYLEEYGVVIPEELILRFKKNTEESMLIQKELFKIRESLYD